MDKIDLFLKITIFILALIILIMELKRKDSKFGWIFPVIVITMIILTVII